MPSGGHRALVWVLGLTPALAPELAQAGPPDPELRIEAASDQPAAPAPADPPADAGIAPVEIEAPSVAPAEPGRLKVITSAVSIRLGAVPIDERGEAIGPAVDLGAPPIDASLPAGRWRLETAGRGYRPWAQIVEIAVGVELVVQVEPALIDGVLLELRAANEVAEGAAASLDGAPLCELPCRATLEPGRHLLEISKRRHKPLSVAIDAVQADSLEIDVELERATSRAPALVVGVVGLGSLTTAIVFTARAARTRRALGSDLDAGVQYDQEDRRIENGRRDAVVAGAMYGVTAALGALTLYYLLRQSGPASRAEKRTRSLADRRALEWTLAPGFGPRGGGLSLTVKF